MRKEFVAGEVPVKSVKVIILSLIFVMAVFVFTYTIVTEILAETMSFLPKLMLVLLTLGFIYDKVIVRLSGYLLNVFSEMGKGKGILESFGNAIPKEDE